MTVMQSEIRVQAGTQSVFVTGVTPTIALRGLEELSIKSANDVEVIGDMTTALAGGDTGIVNSVAATGSMKGWASYEHIAYWLDNLFGQATPSGAGPYVRAYAAPITTAPTPRILSLTKGDSTVGGYQMAGALLSSFTLRFEPKKRTEMSGDLMGVSVAEDALEVLTPPVVTPIMANHLGAIKWDAWGGTMGTTAMALCTVRFAELTVTPDRASRNCFGALTAGSYVEKPWQGSLKLGLEFNATTKTDVSAILTGTLTQKQVVLTATSGSQILKIEFAGTVVDEIEIFGDDDGVVTVDVTLERTYHATFANWLKVTSTNSIATLA